MTHRAHVAFLVPAIRLSGGINVVMEHARNLVHRHGYRVSIVVTAQESQPAWAFDQLADVTVARSDELDGTEFDLAIATFWDTVPHLWRVPAKRQAYFAQSIEDRFYELGAAERSLARMTYLLGLPVITEASWIADTLAAIPDHAPIYYARNGISKGVFGPIPEHPPVHDGPLRILIEATDAWYKGLDDSLDTIRRMQCDKVVTVVGSSPLRADRLRDVNVVHEPMPQAQLRDVYATQHLMLKHSRVEGMYGPPLEGFHAGMTVVTTPVTGHDEYITHGWNGMLIDWDDPSGNARMLDLLATDRRLLEFLRTNALSTARLWPDWPQASEFFASAVAAILERPSTAQFALLRDIHEDARTSIEANAAYTHSVKEKLLHTDLHAQKLDALVAETSNALHRQRVLTEEERLGRDLLAERLVEVTRQLDALEQSRWLKVLSALERPARLVRPGLGSVRGRVQAAARTARTARDAG